MTISKCHICGCDVERERPFKLVSCLKCKTETRRLRAVKYYYENKNKNKDLQVMC